MASTIIIAPDDNTANKQPDKKTMTKAEIVQKILADQKFIREARQKGISFEELRDKYGYRFATV